ncbi:MAG: ribosome maturation factor RimM [Erysipelotrichaceae bacterium]
MIKFGKLTSTKGLKGDLKIFVYREYTDFEFIKSAIFTIKDKKYYLNEFKPYQSVFLINFQDYLDINKIEDLINQDVYVDKSQLRIRDKYYRFELIDYLVLDQDSKEIGTVSEVEATGFQDLLRIKHQDREVLIPLVDAFVKNINKKQQIIRVELIEGLL